MTIILNRLVTQLGRKDENPNIELAHELVNTNDFEGIKEIIENLSNKDKKITQDCIKVAYEIGMVKPELISDYAMVFVELLKSTNNRMVWGAMQALATIADMTSETLMEHLHSIKLAIKTGSVITIDKGILTLAKLAAANKNNNEQIFPFLIEHLKNCRTKEVPQHAESTMIAITKENSEEFMEVVNERMQYMTDAQRKRAQKLVNQIQKQFG